MGETTCTSCDEPVPDGATTITFEGDPYCTDCTTRAECSTCGAVGTVPEPVLEAGAAVTCGNCGEVLRGSRSGE